MHYDGSLLGKEKYSFVRYEQMMVLMQEGAMSDEHLRELMQAGGQSKKRKVDSSKKTLGCECSSPNPSSLSN